MKRGKTEKEICEEMYTTTVKRVFPLFKWKECDECHEKFKYEFGWRYLIDAQVSHVTMGIIKTYGYLCKSCAPSLKAAYYLGESRYKVHNDGMSSWGIAGGGGRPTRPPPTGRKKPSPPPSPPPPKDE